MQLSNLSTKTVHGSKIINCFKCSQNTHKQEVESEKLSSNHSALTYPDKMQVCAVKVHLAFAFIP